MNMGVAERRRLSRLLHEALKAMEDGDEDALRQQIAAISDSGTRAVVLRLGQLARELEQALGELPANPVDARLDDACARLDHVVAMTEQATHRTLDLIEDSRILVAGLQDAGLPPEQASVATELRGHLQEMALAQSHQDLGGQIIRRVAGIVRQVHEQLASLGLPPRGADADARVATSSPDGDGPGIAGIDRDRVDQTDADDLLSRLGL